MPIATQCLNCGSALSETSIIAPAPVYALVMSDQMQGSPFWGIQPCGKSENFAAFSDSPLENVRSVPVAPDPR